MNATAPTTPASDVPDAVSEFELPGIARELVTRILRDLIHPCQKQVASATEARAKVIGKIESALRRVEKARSDATAHLRRRNVEVSAPSQDQYETTTEPGAPADIDVCLQRLEDIESYVAAFTKRNPLRYVPKTGGERIAVSVGMIVVGGVVASATGGGVGSAILIGLGFWVLAVLVARYLWTKGAAERYEHILRISGGLLADLRGIAAAIEAEHQSEVQRIDVEFRRIADDLHDQLATLYQQSGTAGADWNSPVWATWEPDLSPEFAARLGTLKLSATIPEVPSVDCDFEIPALVPFEDGKCLLIDATGDAKAAASSALLSVMLRVLANTPPGKARFTLIDPVGLGQNVADFMHLGDANKDLISGKAWSEPQHIEHQLSLLTEHMETVIQAHLRNEFATIREYNRENREMSEPFRFLVVNDFPVNFTESAARRLMSIVKNGPRCGVYTFIVRDREKKLPHDFDRGDLESAATNIRFFVPQANDSRNGGFGWDEDDLKQCRLVLDGPPPQEVTQRIVKRSGESAIPAMKIDIPFERMLFNAGLTEASWGSESTIEEFRVPLGPSGARGLQHLSLGGAQEAHALLVGRTGSGKTNLMHVIITALALKYRSDEVQLYLVDFKGGVGFKRYAKHRLPHAKVIAIESDREFGMSVLRDLDAELKRRSDKFRVAGPEVDNLAVFRAKMKSEKPNEPPMPRILLIVDEFQEFFTDNDDMAQQAKMIFERLARQGRSYGIHFLLATQSLSGSAQLPSSIMGQVKVRIALPCSEADSRLILADDNKAARALSFPGEAIYNPMAGLIEGNSRFNVARFSDDDLPKYLGAVASLSKNGHSPIIFEGNELAEISECVKIKEALAASERPHPSKGVNVYLGEPVAILPAVTATFRRQSGKNLLILTRDEAEGVGICLAALASISTQVAPGGAHIHIVDFSTSDSEWAGLTSEASRHLPGKISVVNRQRDATDVIATVAKYVQDRAEYVSGQPSVYLIIHGLHRVKALRDDMDDENGRNPVELLKTILRDGPEVGVHVIAWGDTWGNATRGLDRKAMREFGLRVAAAMESGDSMNFLDSLAASKLTKPNRAIFYDDDNPGQLVVFRPYALPSAQWIAGIGETLKARLTPNA